MSVRQPPALAAWLLDRLGYTAVNPALTGDLQEEFQRDRSRAWYWRQVLVVAATFPRRMGILPALYLASLLSGFALEFLAAYALWRLPLPAPPIGPWGAALEWSLFIGVFLVSGLPEVLLLRSARKRAIAEGRHAFRDVLILLATKSTTIFGVFLFCDGLLFCNGNGALSLNALVISHFLWLPAIALFFSLRDLIPAGNRFFRQAKAASLPKHEVALPVRVRRGRTIVLKPELLQEALFASEDSSLRHVLRRAIWLGSARNYQSDLLGESPVLTLSGFTALIKEAARIENLAEAAAIPIPGEVSGIEHELVFVKQ